MSYGEMMNNVVTKLTIYDGQDVSFATGFFYIDIDTLNSDTTENLYIVSNRHVFYPHERIPDSIGFTLIEYMSFDSIASDARWVDFTLKKEELKDRILLSSNADIDVAVLDIDEDFPMTKLKGKYIAKAYSIYSGNMEQNIADTNPEIGDRVMILGFPSGFYDEMNKIPIAKSGMISSFYGRYFNGDPKFLVDSKLYKSFSGAIVLAEPKQVSVKNGQIVYRKRKALVCLGIYSGERYVVSGKEEDDESIRFNKMKMDLGNVWYPKVIQDIIQEN